MNSQDKIMAEATQVYGQNQYRHCFAKTYRLCVWTSPTTQFIGAVLASYYLYLKVGLSLLPEGHRYQIPVALSVVVFALLSLEAFKRLCVLWAFRQSFKRRMMFQKTARPYLTLTGALICMGLSVATSALGAQLYTSFLKDQTPLIEDAYTQKTALVKASFDADIKKQKAAIHALQQRNHRRKWGLTDNETKMLALAGETLERLEFEKKNALFQVKERKLEEIQKAKAKLKTSLVPVVTFAACLELLTISCLGFAEYFKARIFVEHRPKTSVRQKLFQKYPKLVKDLHMSKGGKRQVPVKELSYRHGVSQSTIKRIRREFSQ